jgi:cell division control protein 45
MYMYCIEFKQEDSETGTSILIPLSDIGQVRYVNDDYRFFMHRHWSLYDSMYYSPYIGCKLNTWKSQGANKLSEYLAKVGIPLDQCNQHFSHMRPQLK